MTRLLLTFLVALTAATSVRAETSVWKVQAGHSVDYIGGTCHVLRASDYPLPPEFDHAYRASRTLVLETDVGAMNSAETQQLLLQKATITEGRTLAQVLSPQAYQVLEKACQQATVPLTLLDRLKPPMVVMALTFAELAKLGVSPRSGVDVYFESRARGDGKPIKALESLREQIDLLLSIGAEDPDDFVLYSVQDLERTGEIVGNIIDAWKQGDTKAIEEIILREAKRDYPDLYREIFTERNQSWLPKIEGYLKSPASELILVGVGHLVGSDGVIEQLRKRGYQVEKLRLPPQAASTQPDRD